MSTWPAKLPKPSISGYGGEVEQGVIRTNMDSGRPRQRQRFTSGWRPITAQWKFSDEEYGMFQAFVKYKINGGNDFFDIELPLGDGMNTYSVRFVGGKYGYKYEAHMYWIVTANLECDVTSVIDEAAFDTWNT